MVWTSAVALAAVVALAAAQNPPSGTEGLVFCLDVWSFLSCPVLSCLILSCLVLSYCLI
jgi:hypothetical protein